MRIRTAVLLLLSITGLFLVGVGLGVRLLRAGLHAVQVTTEQRLRAVGATTAQALLHGADKRLLAAVVRENDLEAAYLLDEALRPVPGTAQTGQLVSLLRLDPDRALQALRGSTSVGPAYRLEDEDAGGTTVLAGYFAVPAAADRGAWLLVLEAGASFEAVPAQLRASAWASGAAAFGLAALCTLLVLFSLRVAGREQRLRAEAARGQAVREMAAMVAHELRNPLGTIRAGAELLREQSASAELTGDILSEVARLSTLTTQFLDFSRDVSLSLSDIDLSVLCAELCTSLRREYSDEGTLQIRLESDPTVPLCGDADRLRQVLRNLTQNAVQAMQGRGELLVSVRGLPGGAAEVRVRDTGPGVSAEVRRTLFMPFRTTKPTGTGLGLLVSKRIVDKHGGSLVLADSEPGDAAGHSRRGACFVVRLPAAPPKQAGS